MKKTKNNQKINIMKKTKASIPVKKNVTLDEQEIAKAKEVLAKQQQEKITKCQAILNKAQQDMAKIGFEITPYIQANGTGIIQSGFTFIAIPPKA